MSNTKVTWTRFPNAAIWPVDEHRFVHGVMVELPGEVVGQEALNDLVADTVTGRESGLEDITILRIGGHLVLVTGRVSNDFDADELIALDASDGQVQVEIEARLRDDRLKIDRQIEQLIAARMRVPGAQLFGKVDPKALAGTELTCERSASSPETCELGFEHNETTIVDPRLNENGTTFQPDWYGKSEAFVTSMVAAQETIAFATQAALWAIGKSVQQALGIADTDAFSEFVSDDDNTFPVSKIAGQYLLFELNKRA